jgi:RNA polymerase sigma factor (sigma-70 family)
LSLILSGGKLIKKTEDNDIVLVERVQRGDTSAFGGLVEKYKDVSFTLACSIIRDESIAEDVLQDAFVKAFLNIRKFRGTSSFSTWLYRIVVNTCYDSYRRNKKLAGTDLDEAESFVSESSSGDNDVFQSDRSVYVQTALKKLKPDEALVLRLYYLCEMSMDEIKEITGFGESKIKVTLHRGRHNLSNVLEKMLGNEVNQLL